MNHIYAMPDDASVLQDSIRLMKQALKKAIEDKDTAAEKNWRRLIKKAQRELAGLLPQRGGG